MRVAGAILLATAHAVLAAVLGQRIVALAARFLYSSAAGEAARREGAPGTPAAVHQL